MQQIELKSVYVNDKNAKSEPLLTKKGEPYHRVVIESLNGNKASCNIWANEHDKLEVAKSWKAGQTIEVELTQSGDYTNFDFEATQAPNSTPKAENTNVPTQTSTAPNTAQITPNTAPTQQSMDELMGMMRILQNQNAQILKILVEVKDNVSRETPEQDEELVAFIDEKFGISE